MPSPREGTSMRRFKSGWVLVAVALATLAIGLAILYRDRGRETGAERSSTRALSVPQKSLAEKQPETGVIVKQLAPVLPDFGQAARVEDPQTGKEPIRIKTH
jgi:hypothetical protein